MTNAEAWFNIALRPRKPEGSLGRTAQDGHLDSHTAPELCTNCSQVVLLSTVLSQANLLALETPLKWSLLFLFHRLVDVVQPSQR